MAPSQPGCPCPPRVESHLLTHLPYPVLMHFPRAFITFSHVLSVVCAQPPCQLPQVVPVSPETTALSLWQGHPVSPKGEPMPRAQPVSTVHHSDPRWAHGSQSRGVCRNEEILCHQPRGCRAHSAGSPSRADSPAQTSPPKIHPCLKPKKAIDFWLQDPMHFHFA